MLHRKPSYTPEEMRDSGGRGYSRFLNENCQGKVNRRNGLHNILTNWRNNNFIQQWISNPLFCGRCRNYSVYIDECMIMWRNEYVGMFYKENYGIPIHEIGSCPSIKEHPKADKSTPVVGTILRRFNKINDLNGSDYYECMKSCDVYIDDKESKMPMSTIVSIIIGNMVSDMRIKIIGRISYRKCASQIICGLLYYINVRWLELITTVDRF